MLAEYAGVLVILVVGTGDASAAMIGIHLLLGPRRAKFAEKQEPFECGEHQIVSPHQRYAVKFYMVAILFVVFDVEAIFFYPWGAVFQDPQLVRVRRHHGVHDCRLAVGLVYEWMKGGLEW